MGKKNTKKTWSSQNRETNTEIQVQVRSKKRIRPVDMAEGYIKKKTDQSGFKIRYINDFVGRGVFATRDFEQGDFLMEYSGKLIYGDMALDTDYTYHSVFKGQKFCIDATEEPSSGPQLCRLVNHGDDKTGRNARMKQIEVDGRPHLALFSTRKILQGQEIRYDYGVKNLPWQKQEKLTSPSEDFITINGQVANLAGRKLHRSVEVDELTVQDGFTLASPSEDFSTISGQVANLAGRKLHRSVEVDELTVQDGITLSRPSADFSSISRQASNLADHKHHCSAEVEQELMQTKSR